MHSLTTREILILIKRLGRQLRENTKDMLYEPLPPQITLHILHLQRAEEERGQRR